MTSGAFAEWQPRYAEHNVATFPVSADKVPAVKGYLKVGLRASNQLALKFANDDSFGFACRPNKITVLDVDTPDERVLADSLAKHGPTPFIVRSGSGNFQAWYRHGGERRKVRPDPTTPVDILGDGFVVAPPSLARKGRYQIIQGTLDDLDHLPRMRQPVTGNVSSEPAAEMSNEFDKAQRFAGGIGQRNNLLWRFCMKAVRGCNGDIKKLLELAMEHNFHEYVPLPDEEVLKIVASAWKYELEGKNWFGQGARVVMNHAIVDDLAAREPRAFALLSLLMRHHWGRSFALSKPYAKEIGWAVNTMREARDVLLTTGLLICIHPPQFKFGEGVKN
jgi:hypothetical protein